MIYISLKFNRFKRLRSLQKLFILSFSSRCKAVRDSLDFFNQNFFLFSTFNLTGVEKLMIVFSLRHFFPFKKFEMFLVSKKSSLSFFFMNVNFYTFCINVLCNYSFLPVSETLTAKISYGFRLYRGSYDVFLALKSNFVRRFRGLWFFYFGITLNEFCISWILKNFPFEKNFCLFLLEQAFGNKFNIGSYDFTFYGFNFYSNLINFLLNGLLWSI